MRFLVLVAIAALFMSGAAEARDPRDGKGPFFDGDWTPVKARSHHKRHFTQQNPNCKIVAHLYSPKMQFSNCRMHLKD